MKGVNFLLVARLGPVFSALGNRTLFILSCLALNYTFRRDIEWKVSVT